MSEDLSKRPKKDEEDDDDDEDEDDDFDEEGNAEEEESAGWVDEKPPAKDTEEDEEEDDDDSRAKEGSVVKNNTDSNAPLSSASSSSSLSPAKALPDRLMPKQVASVDEAVKTLLRPNSRPGSRLLVTVEFDQLSIDPDEVRKKLQEEREKLARNKQEGEGGEGEAVEYTATELFQKLQALRPQDNKEGDASGSAGVVPPLNVANVGGDPQSKVESPRPVSPRAAELADMIEKAVEREQQELLRKKQEQEQQQASEQTDEAEELVSPRKRKGGLKFWKKDKKDDKEKEKDKKDKKKVK